MRGAYLLSQLFSGMWFIDQRQAIIAGPTIKRILSGEPITKRTYQEGEENPFQPFAYSPASPGYYSGFHLQMMLEETL